MTSDTTQSENSRKNIWNHRGPVVMSPVFEWPPRPAEAFVALTKRWVTLTRNTLFLLIAMCIYNYFLPDLTVMKSLSLQWIGPVLLRNFLLFLLVTGGLHLFFFTFRKQGSKLKFDHRQQLDKSKLFTFNNQLYDNMFWTLTSGTLVWTSYEVLYFWGVANQVIPVLEFSSQPAAFIAWLLLLPALLSAHFYLIHRVLHWPVLYERFHRLHHRNIQIGPWAGMSMHPVEHVLYISSVLIHYVIPSHPVILLLHLVNRCLVPAFSHAGFEKMLVKDRVVTEAADFHHQLHHKYFDCNYGSVEVPLDRWLNTLHDGSDEATATMRERTRVMARSRKVQTAAS
jgi:lathosterol oxidase